MTPLSSTLPVRTRTFFCFILGALAVSSTPGHGQTQPPSRVRSPTATYTDITPENVVSGYIQSFTHAGFSVKKREFSRTVAGEDVLVLSLSFDAAKPPYDSLYEFLFRPAAGANPHRLTEVTLQRKYITGGDPSHEKEDVKLGDNAQKALMKALSDADAAMGPHQRPPQYMQSW